MGLGFVLTVMMLALAVSVNANYRLAGETSRAQRLQYGLEQMAEQTMARLNPEVRWDGTFDRWGRQGSLVETTTVNNCELTYTADITKVDAGYIHVSGVEACSGQPERTAEMTYLMSPDFTYVQAIGEPGNELQTDGDAPPPLSQVRVCNTPSGSSFTTSVRVASRDRGYVRVYVEGSDGNLRERELVTPGLPVSAGSAVNVSFTDPFEGDGERRINVLFSPGPIGADERVRGGSYDAIDSLAVIYSLYGGCTTETS